MNMLRIGVCGLIAVLALSGLAQAQTPPDPLMPGAAAVDATAPSDPKASEPKKPAPRRAAPRRPAAAGMLTLTINNKRSVGLIELEVGPAGGELKKVQGALAFGRKSVVRIPRVKDCLYDIRGHYADEADTDLTGVDLCKDKAINLTDE